MAGETVTRPQASLGGLFLSPGSRGPQGLWFCPQTALGLNFTSGCHQQCGLGPVTDQPLPAFLSSSGRPRRSWRGVLWEPRLGVGRTGVLSSRRESSSFSVLLLWSLSPVPEGSSPGASPRSAWGAPVTLHYRFPASHTHTQELWGGEASAAGDAAGPAACGDRRDGRARMTEDAAR